MRRIAPRNSFSYAQSSYARKGSALWDSILKRLVEDSQIFLLARWRLNTRIESSNYPRRWLWVAARLVLWLTGPRSVGELAGNRWVKWLPLVGAARVPEVPFNGMSPAGNNDYIKCDLAYAGRSGPPFSDDATSAIRLASQGYPRREQPRHLRTARRVLRSKERGRPSSRAIDDQRG